ncbi:unnamed protein product [Amoebophrya sp. A120]|nr:unnamed protein product [Amoebophrya sp. A120]|eukprot:GSA120T00019168001.1
MSMTTAGEVDGSSTSSVRKRRAPGKKHNHHDLLLPTLLHLRRCDSLFKGNPMQENRVVLQQKQAATVKLVVEKQLRTTSRRARIRRGGPRASSSSHLPFILVFSCEEMDSVGNVFLEEVVQKVLTFKLPDEESRTVALERFLGRARGASSGSSAPSASSTALQKPLVAGDGQLLSQGRAGEEPSQSLLSQLPSSTRTADQTFQFDSKPFQPTEFLHKYLASKTTGFSFTELELLALRCKEKCEKQDHADEMRAGTNSPGEVGATGGNKMESVKNKQKEPLPGRNYSTSVKTLSASAAAASFLLLPEDVADSLIQEIKQDCMSAKKDLTKQVKLSKKDISWDDIGGMETAKKEILDLIELPLSTDPKTKKLFSSGINKQQQQQTKLRSGVLLFGPPGTGKTLLARTVAAECEVSFLSVKGPELLSMYIGESEANVRKVFQSAKDCLPSVLFFDELDSLAPARGKGSDSGGVMDRIVSQLLTELDQVPSKVFVLGATNRPDLLDSSLLRPGRLDRTIYLGISQDKLPILKAATRKLAIGREVDLAKIAAQLPAAFTGADTANLAQEAYQRALQERTDFIKFELCEGQDVKVTTFLLEVEKIAEEINESATAQNEISSSADTQSGFSKIADGVWEKMATELGVAVETTSGVEEDDTGAGGEVVPRSSSRRQMFLAKSLLEIPVKEKHFLQALEVCHPSVTKKELEKYELLAKEYRNA